MQNLIIQHILHVMQCEKNNAENVMKTIFEEKDTLRVCFNMKDVGIPKQLWPIQGGEPCNIILPRFLYVLTR